MLRYTPHPTPSLSPSLPAPTECAGGGAEANVGRGGRRRHPWPDVRHSLRRPPVRTSSLPCSRARDPARWRSKVGARERQGGSGAAGAAGGVYGGGGGRTPTPPRRPRGDDEKDGSAVMVGPAPSALLRMLLASTEVEKPASSRAHDLSGGRGRVELGAGGRPQIRAPAAEIRRADSSMRSPRFLSRGRVSSQRRSSLRWRDTEAAEIPSSSSSGRGGRAALMAAGQRGGGDPLLLQAIGDSGELEEEAPAAARKGPSEGARQLGAAASRPWWALAEPLDSAGFGGVECPRENPVSDAVPHCGASSGKSPRHPNGGSFPGHRCG
jgi:hypothetical protein